MEQQVIKVFGERNTGTRAVIGMLHQLDGLTRRVQPLVRPDGALEAAIEGRFVGAWRKQYLDAMRDAASSRNDPWKHACAELTPAMVEAKVSTIFMLRDPYSWFLALARHPYHMKGPASASLEDFADRPWMTERREGLPPLVASPIDLWTRKTRSYQQFAQDAYAVGLNCAFIGFEDFVADNVRALGGALTSLNIPYDDLRPVEHNTKNDTVLPIELARYYSDGTWRGRLTAPLIRRLNDRIDWDLAARFGYERLEPADYPERLSPVMRAAISREMSSLRTVLDRNRELDRKTGSASAA